MKKIKYLILVMLLIFSLGFLFACSDEESQNTDEITKEFLESLVFVDATFEYDGQRHSIYVENVPDEVKVTYYGNDQSNPGTHTVNAFLTYNSINVQKSASIIIISPETEIIADENQVLFIYGDMLEPQYSLNNEEQSVVFKYYKDGVEVSKHALTTPGTYSVEIIAQKSTLYTEKVKMVTVTTTNSLLGLSYADLKVEYDGSEHQILLSGATDLANEYTISYSNNTAVETGTYYALAEVKDSSGVIVETHAAILEIVNPENEEFNDFLDMFFVEYLEEDQLSVNIFCEKPDNFGLTHYAAEWYAYEASTEEEITEYVQYLTDLLNQLEAFKEKKLSKLQEVAYRNVESFLKENLYLYTIEDIEYLNLQYVDSFGGYVADFSTYMEAYSLYSVVEVLDIISFIKSTKTAFPSYLNYVNDRYEAGYALSDYTITEMRGYLEDVLGSKEKYYLADVINAKIEGLDFLNDNEKESYKEEVIKEFNDSFMYGVQTLYDGLENYLGKLAEEDEGYLAIYKSGKDVYLNKLDSLLGLNDFNIEDYIKEVETAFRKTNAEVVNIQSSIVRANNITTYDQLNSYLAQFKIFDGTPEEMMEFLKEFALTIVPELKENPNIVIKNMDMASAKVSNAVAYYMKSALDNSKSEYITLNPVKLGDKNDVLGTLAHEGYPGHLYAYVYSKEIGQHNLSTIMTSTAHGEGWATYVEVKLYEYAISKSDDPDFIQAMQYLLANHLSSFLLETLVDVGIHYQGWTVEDVYRFFYSAGYVSGDAASYESEIEYVKGIFDLLIEMPTTYAAYGYGKLYFMNLHNEAQNILGAYYDEVEFNAMLHSRGWTNLGELENTYNEYIKAKCHKYGIEFNA